MSASTRRTRRTDDEASTLTKKAKVEPSLALLRAEYEKLIQEKEDIEKRQVQEGIDLVLERDKVMNKLPDHSFWSPGSKEEKENEAHSKKFLHYCDLQRKMCDRQAKEWKSWQEKMNTKEPPEPLNYLETNAAIHIFCQWQQGGILGQLIEFLDHMSLFNWGRAIVLSAFPLTLESQPLLEFFKSSLLRRTANPSMEVDIESLFQNPSHPADSERSNARIGYGFQHKGPRTLTDPEVWNEFYDTLSDIQKEQWRIQVARKEAVMKNGMLFDSAKDAYNKWVYGAYNFRGYGWAYDEYDSEFDENCQDHVKKKIGAYAANRRDGDPSLWFEIFLLCAGVCARLAEREYILLNDVMYAAEMMNFRFSFPTEKRHTINLLNGNTISATLQEIASFLPNFVNQKMVEENPDDYFDSQFKATNSMMWEDFVSVETLRSKAKANIEEHIAQGTEWLGGMKVVVEEELLSFECTKEGENSSVEDEDIILNYRQQLLDTPDDQIEDQARSKQVALENDLNMLVTTAIPLLEPEVMPELVGDSLKFLNACSFAIFDRFDKKLFPSISASLFLQQLFEEISLGTALKPFPLKTRQENGLVNKEKERSNNPPSDLVHIVLCPNGTTVVSKNRYFIDPKAILDDEEEDDEDDEDYVLE